uniref:ribonuclease H n=1 Tax=Rhizophagus irregularis (strain DAOM 181602 / DAOM 197198 / MUCL 43194) TaxID=747089 RepID=U9SG20_RHIID
MLLNKNIFFLDQIISNDGAFLKTWKEIKKLLKNNRRRRSKWYDFLKDNIVLNPSTNRLQFTTQSDNMSPDLGFPRPKIIKCNNHSVPCKNQWAAFWSPRVSSIVYGKILEKSHFPGDSPKVYLEHHIPFKDMSNPNHNITPHSTPNLLTPCTGCDLHDSFYIGDSDSELRADTFKDYKIRTDPLFRNRIISSQSNTPHLYIPSNINHRLVNGLLLPNDIFNEFYILINNLASFTNLEFYTDGSLKIDDDNPRMGFGWIFTSDTNLNIKFSTQWPSSTRAEIMAVLTCLIVCPPNSLINIFTDSQCTINTFTSLSNYKLTPRRKQKINNIIFWQAIQQIIAELNLQVQFTKVKAHSGVDYNDRADKLAKDGCDFNRMILISPKGVKAQKGYIMFNNDTIIDHNIRKTLKKPINFRYIERQISLKPLHALKSFTTNHIINWEFSQLWINHNPFQKATSESYSKHVGWRIKCSNYALPTLDALNQNYPDILNGYDTCFLCSSAVESNEHFWTCPKSIDILKSIFKNHELKF